MSLTKSTAPDRAVSPASTLAARRSPEATVRKLLRAVALFALMPGACVPAPRAAPGEFLRGTISNGRGLFFQQCGEQGRVTLRTVDDATRDVVEQIMGGGQPIYAEVIGSVRGRVPTLTTARVIYASRDTPGCDGPAPEFDLRGQGNEPFWSLQIRDDIATWSTPEELDGPRFEVGTTERVGDGWLLDGTSAGRTMRASFAATPCRDSMADTWYGYTVEVDIDGTVFRGCGRPGTR